MVFISPFIWMHYIDALPETSEDAALKHLVRYLETHRLQPRLQLPMFLSPMHKKHNNLDRQERFLKFMAERKVTLDDLKQNFIKNWLSGHHYRSNNPIADQITDREPEYLESYYNLGLKRPIYLEEKQPNENDDRLSKDFGYGQTFDVDRDQVESILDKYIDLNHMVHGLRTLHHEGGKGAAPIHSATSTSVATEPEFTYKFDNSNLKEKHPFAVKPNDPRYHSEAPFSSGIHISFINLPFIEVL